jgi:hypothetical protein
MSDKTTVLVPKAAHESFVAAIEGRYGHKRGLVGSEAEKALRRRTKQLRREAEQLDEEVHFGPDGEIETPELKQEDEAV